MQRILVCHEKVKVKISDYKFTRIHMNQEEVVSKNSLVVLKKEDGYTTFKNHDEDLVAKIKAVTLEEESFQNWNDDKCTIDKSLSDTQYLCKVSGGEFFTLNKERYKEGRKEELINKINNLYPVHRHWESNFGSISDGYDRIGVIGSDDGKHDDLQKVSQVNREVSVSDYYGIEVLADMDGVWSQIMFCHFDVDGNYSNRDYNIDIELSMKGEKKDSSDLMKEVLAAIPDVEYQYAKDKWFSEDFAFQIEWSGKNEDGKYGFELVRYDRVSEFSDRYTSDGYGRSINKLKRTEPKTRQDILDRIKDALDPVCEYLDK